MDGFIPGGQKPDGANSPIELLYEDAGTGKLQIGGDGRAFRMADLPGYSGPSLSGPEPTFGRHTPKIGPPQAPPRGLGGSQIDAGRAQTPARGVSQNPEASLAAMTPEQLMVLAKRMEEDLVARQRAEEGSTAVDSTIIKSRYGGSITPDAPDWLVQYMEGQQPMGDAQFGGPGLDKVKAKQYLSQQEMLRHLKAQQ